MSGKKLFASIIPAIFAVAGLFILIKVTIPLTLQWVENQNLSKVEGTLIETDLSWKPNDSGEYEYTLSAIYRYELHGKSSAVEITEGDKVDSSYHYITKRNKEAIIEEWKSESKKTLYIDPRLPEQHQEVQEIEAVFWLLIVLLPSLFTFLGLFLIYKIFKSKERELKDPSKPWLEKREWQTAHITCTTVKSKRGLIYFATFWNLIVFTIFGVVINENGFKDPVLLLIAVFPVIGIFLLFNALSKIVDLAKYSTAALQLDPFPASIGGDFGGQIHFKKAIPENSTIEITLSSIKVSYSGAGDDKSRSEDLMWQKSGFAYLNQSTLKQGEFKLKIPALLEETSLSREGTHWTVVATVSFDKHHFSRLFQIPVYKTEQNSLVEVDSSTHPAAKSYAAELINDVTEFAQTGNQYSLQFPNFRILKSSILLGILIGGGLLTGAVFNFINEDLPLLFTIMFFFFGFIFFGLALFEGFYTLKVHLKPEKLITQHRWMGIPIKKRSYLKEDIKSFTIGDYVRSNTNNGRHTAYYKISILDRKNESSAVAIRLKNRATADQMIHFFNTYYQLPVE